MTASVARTRLPQLDGLRAVAIALVLASHLWPLPTVKHLGLDKLWAPPLGHVGVSLFFVLSGFLITRILLASRDRQEAGATLGSQLWPFYARRFLRIVPAYTVLLAVLVCGGVQRADERLVWHATYTSNVILASDAEWAKGGFDRHLWSLSVEEQFYLVWPLLVLLTPRLGLLPMMVLTFAGGTLWRSWCLWEGTSFKWTEITTPANADLLAAGGLLALVALPRSAAWAMTLIVLPVALLLNGPLGNWQIGPRIAINNAILALGLAGLVRLCDGTGGPLAWRPLAYVGTISYAAYLVHTVCGELARRMIGADANVWLLSITATSLTLGIASLSWHAFESPILRLKRLVPYR